MQKFLTDVHTHSDFSYDGVSKISDMLQTAREKGLAFYGVSEHFDFDVGAQQEKLHPQPIDAEEYFHTARHLQEDYAGCMNVLVGAEFGYSDDKKVQDRYALTYEKYRPDFVVNSVHTYEGTDYYYREPYYKNGSLLEKREAYGEYLALVRRSLDAPYPYDIVGHIGYAMRYAPYADKSMRYADYAEIFDDILRTIVEKNKILELNASGGADGFLPSEEIFRRYYALGGRKVSYASDAHTTERVAFCRREAVGLLKAIGFTHVTVPCKGEHIELEL